MTDPNEQAFPRPTAVWGGANTNGDHPIVTEGGLTKREWLAGIMCAGLQANPEVWNAYINSSATTRSMHLDLANHSVQQADALIAALNRKPDAEK